MPLQHTGLLLEPLSTALSLHGPSFPSHCTVNRTLSSSIYAVVTFSMKPHHIGLNLIVSQMHTISSLPDSNLSFSIVQPTFEHIMYFFFIVCLP